MPTGITDGLELIDPASYGAQGPPHETWTRLRAESPVHLCEPPGFGPFWAITKHEDICRIGKDPETIRHAGTTPPSDGRPIDLSGPTDPRYAEDGA